MKKIYNRPCVDVLLFTTSSTILDGSQIKVDTKVETDGEELTGGYREWDNIWGE